MGGGAPVSAEGFVPPPYPYERLGELRAACAAHEGGIVDCSIGTPCDPTPPVVLAAMRSSVATNGYPPSAGTVELRDAARGMLERRFGVEVGPDALAACVGTKEFVATLAHLLSLRDPGRDTVLYPAIAYPTYEVSARLARLRGVPVAVREGRLELDSVDPADARRALVLWVNSPSNPTGRLDDLDAAVAFGRRHGIVVASDECYAEFTWHGPPRTVLRAGTEGVLAVHSVSKRSNLAGARAGFYAGDAAIVAYLRAVRQHAGLIVPGPLQDAAAAAFGDDDHVEAQRRRYRARLDAVGEALRAAGYDVGPCEGTFYLWVARAGQDDAWALAREFAEGAGMLVSPGDLYGPGGAGHVRIAMVQPDERLALACARLASARALHGA